MIARIAIPIIIIVLIATLFVDRVMLRKRSWWVKWPLWLLSLLTIAKTVQMARVSDYFPDDIRLVFRYIDIIVLYIVPLTLITFFSVVGFMVKRQKAGTAIGICLSVAAVACYVYGKFVGSNELEVRRVELAFDELPEAFDGYKIVQFSDIHLGSMIDGRKKLLQAAIDSINAQKADLVAFCGDIQDKQPSEIEPFVEMLSKIEAKDGVFSVLGNHDYTQYLNTKDAYILNRNLGLVRSMQEDMGWTVLDNSHVSLRRDSSRIVIAGMENDGEGHFPQLGNINTALWGVSRQDFVVMIEHDPTSWRRKILPHSHTQLTLSGHTHGGQVKLFGWSPASFIYHEIEGIYRLGGNRILSVTRGLGGVIPFRFACPSEVVVITLRKSHLI